MVTVAAYTFTCFVSLAAAFQIALAAGAPWGSIAMGGRFPGTFPPALRALAVLQCLVLIFFGVVVLVRSEIILPEWFPAAERGIWIVVAFSVLSTIANLATPSRWERIVWAPVAAILLASSLIVALH